jgi:hypothetical protein
MAGKDIKPKHWRFTYALRGGTAKHSDTVEIKIMFGYKLDDAKQQFDCDPRRGRMSKIKIWRIPDHLYFSQLKKTRCSFIG